MEDEHLISVMFYRILFYSQIACLLILMSTEQKLIITKVLNNSSRNYNYNVCNYPRHC